MTRSAGSALLPSITNRSKPAFFRAGPMVAPAEAFPYPPVRGDFAMKRVLEAVGIPVPVRSPGATISLLSTLRGSQLLSISEKRSSVAKPIPPKNFLGHSGRSPSILNFFSVKLTLSILPVYPFMAIPREVIFLTL